MAIQQVCANIPRLTASIVTRFFKSKQAVSIICCLLFFMHFMEKKQNEPITRQKSYCYNNLSWVAQYKASLMGKSFLYVLDNRCIEVIFRRKDFFHLTSVDTTLSADQFFKNAINHTLRAKQIDFSQRHLCDLCIQKTDKLSDMPILTNSEILILEDMATPTYTYEFCLTELKKIFKKIKI